jgi:hypothetical protein
MQRFAAVLQKDRVPLADFLRHPKRRGTAPQF